MSSTRRGEWGDGPCPAWISVLFPTSWAARMLAGAKILHSVLMEILSREQIHSFPGHREDPLSKWVTILITQIKFDDPDIVSETSPKKKQNKKNKALKHHAAP